MSSPLIFAAGEASTTFGPLDFAIAGSLLFWGLICFLIYYFFLAPRLMTRSEAIMEDRDQTVKGDLAAAEDANAKAADLLAQYEAKLDEARSNASEAVRTVLAEADKKAIAAENRVSKKIAEQAADADDAIRAAFAEAAADLSDSAATTAQAAVERLAGLKVTNTVAKDAVKATA